AAPEPADEDLPMPEPVPGVNTYGLDATLTDAALERAAELEPLQSLVIARHGEVMVAENLGGPGLDTPVNVKSVSKSILSALVGRAIEEGYLDSTDQPIGPFVENYLTEDDDPRKRNITLAHLLTMQSGLERTSGSNYGSWVSSSNWVRNAIRRPLHAAPGTARRYSTGNSHLLSAVLTQATGQSTWAFAQDYLAEPLGIRLPPWPTDPQGIYFGGNDMLISPRDLLRFGEMYRQGGMYNGTRVLSNEWVRQSWIPRSESRWSGAGYGYSWFKRHVGAGYHATYYGWGYGGQYLFIVPALELTVVATSNPYHGTGRSHRTAVQEVILNMIVPAAEKGQAPVRPAHLTTRPDSP
ncbi:MAG: serine hydrolase, partial [Longimonas sp.]|uniref:serine hydrolase domain-containing protein n=1 Tax=Longimonas sp. TaxID=2039626 RepID=UPI00335043B2